MRQIFSLNYNNFWISFGPEVREKFHEQILKCVKDETKPNLVKRLTEIIAIIAQKNLSNNCYLYKILIKKFRQRN